MVASADPSSLCDQHCPVDLDAAIGMSDPTSGIGLLSSVWVLIVLIPSILVYIKRFHDRNKSGWWVLIGFVPIIGAL